MAHLDELQSEVERNGQVVESAIVLIQGLAEKLDTMAEDPGAIKALATELRAKSDALATAVQANTPQAPPA